MKPTQPITQVKPWGIVATVLRQYEQLSDAALINTDEIDSDKKDMFAPYRDPPDEEFLAKIKIEGSEELQP
jgi:hypothetical protein